jgi:hypothetical protein
MLPDLFSSCSHMRMRGRYDPLFIGAFVKACFYFLSFEFMGKPNKKRLLNKEIISQWTNMRFP